MSLGDDMLGEILIRLPSLPSLASAALASPRLCSVASSPAISDRFLSRAPLLGYFVSAPRPRGAVPAFHRALLRRDRHLAAVVRRGDFHLTDFEEYKWRIMDCRHGLLLLSSDPYLVVFDPISHSRLRITHNHKSITSNSSQFHCFLPACSVSPTSFRVLSLENRSGRVLAHVYSSRTGEWCSHTRAPEGITAPRSDDHRWPVHSGGSIYWRGSRLLRLTSLHVGSMEFCHVALPKNLDSDPSLCVVGETEDGTTCLVAMVHSLLRVWFRKEDKSWEQQWEVDASKWYPLLSHVKKVCGVTAGVVLISMGIENGALHYCAFRLIKNALQPKLQLEADFFTSSGWVRPYFMAWPRPTLKAGSSNTKKTSLEDQEAGGSKKKTSLKHQEAGS
ncbi:hypothetical protein VPH35_135127 [Triticum aestivum]|uniref:uncharacterized protein n=1 Tax=Triticum aestivum TaxID=4565 RepID=UPI001D0046E9|nr:uncharacterized protein LOC123170794 [Triticum aestivum]